MAIRDADFLRYKALLFVFPGAVLANTTSAYISPGTPVGLTISFVLIFLFIAVEAYSSHLWETVDRLRRNETSLDYIQETFLAFIDLLRISLLTLAIGIFPELHKADVNLFPQFAMLLAGFLILNFLWNLVARPLKVDIRKLFDAHFQKIKGRGASPLEKGLGIATRQLLALNRIAFFWFFPAVAILTVLYFAFALVLLPYTDALTSFAELTQRHHIGLFATFLLAQIVLKITQVGAIRLALSWDTRVRSNSTAGPGAMPGQGASDGDYEVYIVDNDELRLRRTTLKLPSLLNARSRIYYADKRRTYAEIEQLVFDPIWDEISAHIVCMEGGSILGMIRVTPSREDRLPISEQFGESFGSYTYELSRIIVDNDYRGSERKLSLIAMQLFVGCAEYLSSRPVDAIVIDAIVGTNCVIKERTYKRMGFVSQDMLYRDHRYGADSIVLKTSGAQHVTTFYEWAHRMRARWATGAGASSASPGTSGAGAVQPVV